MQFAKQHKKEALQASFAAGLTGDPDVASRSYDFFSSGYAADLAVAQEGIQIMLDEDIRAELVEKNSLSTASSTTASSNKRNRSYATKGV
jgi:hypothetical protein